MKIDTLLVMAAHCFKHPKYKMVRKPASKCSNCWKLWKYKLYKTENPDTCSCVLPWCTTNCGD